MKTIIFQSKELKSLSNKVNTFKAKNDVALISEYTFFDRLAEKETTVICYYI